MTRLLITMGDPAGVGPEVLLKALGDFKPPSDIRIGVIADRAWLSRLSAKVRLPVAWNRFEWMDLPNVPKGLIRGRVQARAGAAAHQYLQEAVRLLKRGHARALVTAPVSKEAMVKAAIPWIGHTEFLAKAFRTPTVMMFVTGKFRVSLVTTHVAMRRLSRVIRREKVVLALRMTQDALRRDFGVARPRIGLAALNPHGGEGGLFGDEEKRILRPALARMGAGIAGPLPADSLMQSAARGAYDAVVALYHDQALIPVKLLGWEKAVNVTLGLPFVRTSPVHGTAFDLAGKGTADPGSMQSAIALAMELARRRAAV